MISASRCSGYMKVSASWSCMERMAVRFRQILSIAALTMSAREHWGS